MDKKTILLLGIILIVLLIVTGGAVIFFFGFKGLWQIAQILGIILIAALFIALAVYLAWYFFIKKHKLLSS